jgi:hypothetical protein
MRRSKKDTRNLLPNQPYPLSASDCSFRLLRRGIFPRDVKPETKNQPARLSLTRENAYGKPLNSMYDGESAMASPEINTDIWQSTHCAPTNKRYPLHRKKNKYAVGSPAETSEKGIKSRSQRIFAHDNVIYPKQVDREGNKDWPISSWSSRMDQKYVIQLKANPRTKTPD